MNHEINHEAIQKPELGYRHQFSIDELDAAQSCVEAHGFAVIQKMLPDDTVAALQASVLQVVDPQRDLAAGQSRTHTSFMEFSPAMQKLLDYEPFMQSQRVFSHAGELTLNRSAAIIRMPGSAPLAWHSDWRGFSQEAPKSANDFLNRGEWPSGVWFYLTGSNPQHGGLAVIEDSHVPEWRGPEGFEMTPDRVSFYRRGADVKAHVGMDVPGLVPLITEPGDMIVFAHRTYHAAYPNQTDRVRLSCGLNFRPRTERIDAPWPLPESAQAFVNSLPPRLQPLVENYTGVDFSWRRESMMG
jgi:ectoine hydroxylase-related dioxygenase (phytanoyl-CoA dioxygenase family)